MSNRRFSSESPDRHEMHEADIAITEVRRPLVFVAMLSEEEIAIAGKGKKARCCVHFDDGGNAAADGPTLGDGSGAVMAAHTMAN